MSYYVLYETGNEGFFSCIAGAFCRAALELVKTLYENYSCEFLQPKSEALDSDGIDKFFEKNTAIMNILTPMNCTIFKDTISCGNPNCKASYTAALASDQIEIFSLIMTEVLNKFENNNFPEKEERLKFHTLVQSYKIINIQGIEEIKISSKNHPVEFKRKNPSRYLRQYMKKTNALIHKANNFSYVYAQMNSDYGYFITRTKLPNVNRCSALQVKYP